MRKFAEPTKRIENCVAMGQSIFGAIFTEQNFMAHFKWTDRRLLNSDSFLLYLAYAKVDNIAEISILMFNHLIENSKARQSPFILTR